MMSLTPYLPPTSGDADAMLALLQTISNPAEAKKSLDRMIKEREAIEQATETQRKMLAEAQADMKKGEADAQKAKAEADRLATKSAIDLGSAKAALAEAERKRSEMEAAERRAAEAHMMLDEREQRLKAQEGEALDMARTLQMRERDVEKVEQQLKQRESDLVMREKTLADDIAEHNAWLAGLKPPRAR